jgi:hypothetical protein
MTELSFTSRICGEYLDHEKWAPFFSKANELEATILLHPMSPFGVEKMQEYGLAPLVGFVFDTTELTKIIFLFV